VVGGVPARSTLDRGRVLLVGVMTVSITRNVPVNRLVSRLDPPSAVDWASIDPRPWRRWNLIRTVARVAGVRRELTAAAQLR